jgi:hypothetical protein
MGGSLELLPELQELKYSVNMGAAMSLMHTVHLIYQRTPERKSPGHLRPPLKPLF